MKTETQTNANKYMHNAADQNTVFISIVMIIRYIVFNT